MKASSFHTRRDITAATNLSHALNLTCSFVVVVVVVVVLYVCVCACHVS